MIHIIGTNHELQHTGTPGRLARLVPAGAALKAAERARDDLKAYLRQLAREIGPAVLAEEFCQDALPPDAASNVKAVADELCIEHRFCDPGREERMKLGLPWYGTEGYDQGDRASFDAIREEFWLGALADVLIGRSCSSVEQIMFRV